METLFRKKIVLREQKILPSLESRNEVKLKLGDSGKQPKRNDLPLPPDINNLAPLEKVRLKPSSVEVTVTTTVKATVPPTIIYEIIPLDSKLTRNEISEIVKAGIHDAAEEFKLWVLAKGKFEEQQRASRITELENVRKEKEEDRILNLARIESNKLRQKPGVSKLMGRKRPF
jgi:hypothetical protein